MERAEALDRLSSARVARLATITPDGRPHLVAITFAVLGDAVVHMIDDKPKTTPRLQRLVNVEATPRASLLVDSYDEDWSKLWWVRVDGEVSIARSGALWESARSSLGEKYPQYRSSPPGGPAIFLAIDHVTHWEGS
ncbi:MAG TPA: TIGR03668 family PPOX class F420-dependent oxidoreductase [Acidimicrobiia bacterium]|nr:TIGR03668 family PPOX class F420-dependent oxidoreductase [Acidimicrobiia bacterium]